MPHSSPWAPAAGLIATAGMPVRALSQRASVSISSSAPCTVDERLERMDVGEARQPRHLLVEPRIVLHRAGAERIEPDVDARNSSARAACNGAPPAARLSPGRPIGPRRRSAPSRSATGRGGSADRRRVRPGASCSNSSGSSISSPRLPVSVGALDSAMAARKPESALLHSLIDSASASAGGQGGDIVLGRGLGRRQDQEIGELGPLGQEPRSPARRPASRARPAHRPPALPGEGGAA